MWFLYALASGISAALLAMVINMGLRKEDALLMTTFFSLIMTIMLFMVCFSSKRFESFSITSLGGKEWLALLLAGFFAGAGYLAYFLALKSGPICYVVAIDRLSILYVVVLSYFLLNAKINMLTLGGALLIILGTFLISLV